MSPRAYVIGLTGNIATGKSTVARMLIELGACLIDGDRVAHEIMRSGTAVFREVIGRFGERILDAAGEIDRRALGQIVFSDPEALRLLDSLAHPAVRQETRRRALACAAQAVVVEAVKLVEAGMDADCDAVWLVTAPREIQVARLMQRSGYSRQEAELRIDAQGPQSAKLARADVVIDNGGCLKCTLAQVQRAWRRAMDSGACHEEAR